MRTWHSCPTVRGSHQKLCVCVVNSSLDGVACVFWNTYLHIYLPTYIHAYGHAYVHPVRAYMHT